MAQTSVQAGEIRLDTRELDRIARSLKMNVDQVLGNLAHEVEQAAKLSMKESGTGKAHVPSAPGQPPNVDTSALKNSIKPRRISYGKLHYVEVLAEYGLYLEFGHRSRPFKKTQGAQRWIAKRPFMIPACEKVRKMMADKYKAIFR